MQPTLSYSSPPNAAPFSLHQQGTISGLCAELVTRFSKANLLIPNPVLVPWKRSFVLASQGQLDLICGLYKNQQRQKIVDYSVAFAEEEVSLFVVSASASKYQQWSDLIGLRGAATVGDSWGTKFDRYIADNLSVMSVVTLHQGMKMLNAGRLDYVIATHYQGLQTLAAVNLHNNIKPHPVRLVQEKLYFAFSKSSPHKGLLIHLNNWLEQTDTRQFIQRYLAGYEQSLITDP